jgi:hypothetical protein
MKRLLLLSALLLGISFSSLAKPAMAVVYPPCDTTCGSNPSTRCSCPGTVHNVTCGTWQSVC